MRLSDRLAQVETAEEFFELFGLEYDRHTLTVYRLQILRRFGSDMKAIDETVPGVTEDDRWRRYAGALKQAHDHYAAGPSESHPFPGVGRGLVRLGRKPSTP